MVPRGRRRADRHIPSSWMLDAGVGVACAFRTAGNRHYLVPDCCVGNGDRPGKSRDRCLSAGTADPPIDGIRCFEVGAHGALDDVLATAKTFHRSKECQVVVHAAIWFLRSGQDREILSGLCLRHDSGGLSDRSARVPPPLVARTLRRSKSSKVVRTTLEQLDRSGQAGGAIVPGGRAHGGGRGRLSKPYRPRTAQARGTVEIGQRMSRMSAAGRRMEKAGETPLGRRSGRRPPPRSRAPCVSSRCGRGGQRPGSPGAAAGGEQG